MIPVPDFEECGGGGTTVVKVLGESSKLDLRDLLVPFIIS